MFRFKGVVAAVTVATMIGTSAFAADMSLAPGKPAGVEKAQFAGIGTGTLIIAGASAAIITAVAIVVSQQNNNNNSGAANTFAPASTSATTP
jgi:hypothetical protein